MGAPKIFKDLENYYKDKELIYNDLDHSQIWKFNNHTIHSKSIYNDSEIWYKDFTKEYSSYYYHIDLHGREGINNLSIRPDEIKNYGC